MQTNSLLILMCLTAVAATVKASEADSPQGHTSSLFDGKTLNGWTIENDCEVEVQEGHLLLKAGDGWLRSDHTYGDFVLHVEWQALQGQDYDAGIYLRAGRDGKPFPKRGYQVNLLQGKEGQIGKLKGADVGGTIHPPGQWNAFDITVRGDTVAVAINGTPAYKTNGLQEARGHVGFQVEVPKGGQFLIRNVTITELDYRSLFNGKDLAGWEGAGQPAKECWTVADGNLTCTGTPGPWLRSAEEFDDFNLRLQYRLQDGGNSGIYVRVPENGNHHRKDDQQPPAGFEVQVLDDSAEKHRNLKDYQYCGSVYDIAGATQHVSKPTGEWNTLEINCRGQHVHVTHNGVDIVSVDPEKFPLINLRKTKGYLGLQNHRSIVDFRNLRVGPAIAYGEQ